ncbi:MAG: hypothetical protein U0441_17875 [Polyangiaceae bacterium]
MATKKKSSAPDDVPTLFAAAARSTGDGAQKAWEAAVSALVKAIAACESAADLGKLLRTPGVSDGFFGEADAWPEVADAIIALADACKDTKEGARILGWAARGCAFLPSALVRPDLGPSYQRKPRFSAAVDKHAPMFRAWLVDASPERRSAGAHLLAWCTSTTDADVAAVRAQAAKEKNAAALASELLTLGVLSQRHHKHEAIALATAGLARVTSAVAAALSGATLSKSATEALAEHVTKPASLPAEWGWHAANPPAIASDTLAVAVLCWARSEAPEIALGALLGKDVQKLPLGFVDMVGDAIANMAFAARGAKLPTVVTPAELDELQRKAVTAFAAGNLSRANTAIMKLGLPRGDDIPRLLAGKDLDMRPLPITVKGKAREWHFARIWAAVLFEEVTVEDACAALLRAVSPAEAVELVSVFTGARNWAYVRPTTDAEWERDQALCLAVMDAAKKAGLDVASTCLALAKKVGALPGILAIAYLRERPGPVAEADVPFIVSGVSAARCAEPIRSLLSAMPEASRKAILHQTMVGGNSLRVLDLCLDEVILKKLVAFATGPWAKQFREQILAMLSRHEKAPGVADAIAAIRAKG